MADVVPGVRPPQRVPPPCLVLSVLALACAAKPGAHPPLRLADFPHPSPAMCRPIDPGALGPIDVVIAVDTSRSSSDMTGFDINGNGVVGESETIERGPPPVWITSDPGDSFLAVQVVAGRALARRLSAGGASFAVVSYSGAPSRRRGAPPAPSVDHAISEGAPTVDPDQLARGPAGATGPDEPGSSFAHYGSCGVQLSRVGLLVTENLTFHQASRTDERSGVPKRRCAASFAQRPPARQAAPTARASA